MYSLIQSSGVSTTETNYKPDSVVKTGNFQSRKVIPASHSRRDNNRAAVIVSIAALLIILGIIFWAVGASHGNPSMTVAGKVLFGIGFAPLGLLITCCCCAICSGRKMQVRC